MSSNSMNHGARRFILYEIAPFILMATTQFEEWRVESSVTCLGILKNQNFGFCWRNAGYADRGEILLNYLRFVSKNCEGHAKCW